jgi:hypothetical protein
MFEQVSVGECRSAAETTGAEGERQLAVGAN